jgi:NADPH-dependent 2,4-dienoyl-CoA reductase/sulfur reductase-like enzyme
MAAAVRASEGGVRVTVIDDNPGPGGQIWRGEQHHPSTGQAALWFARFRKCSPHVVAGARVLSVDTEQRALLVESSSGALWMKYSRLILATGARELFLPFPGWTLPNVMGVGGLQAFAKSGLDLAGKRIVVAGSGPLLLAAAHYFRKRGAIVPLIAEQAPLGRLLRFGLALMRHPGKLRQALALRLTLVGTRYLPGCWVEAAHGSDAVESIRLRHGSRILTEPCDYLAVAHGFRPNNELASLAGCEMDAGFVRVDELQQTSLSNVYCAGEATGIGGAELSSIEGEIAGYAAAGNHESARRLFATRCRARHFAHALNRAFALRDELRHLAASETIVCRCEDVPFSKLQTADSWRAAKLHLRCGMGPCQGRVCGPATEFLFGWHAESVRPPLFPARIDTLQEALSQ